MSETKKLLINKYLNGAETIPANVDNADKAKVPEKTTLLKKIAKAYKKMVSNAKDNVFSNLTANVAAMWLYSPVQYSEHLNKEEVSKETPKSEKKLPADSANISASEAFMMLYSPKEFSELKAQRAIKGKDGR